MVKFKSVEGDHLRLSDHDFLAYFAAMRNVRYFSFFNIALAWLLAAALVFAPPIKLVSHASAETIVLKLHGLFAAHETHHHHDFDKRSRHGGPKHDFGDHSHDFGVRLTASPNTVCLANRQWTTSVADQLHASPIFLLERPPRV